MNMNYAISIEIVVSYERAALRGPKKSCTRSQDFGKNFKERFQLIFMYFQSIYNYIASCNINIWRIQISRSLYVQNFGPLRLRNYQEGIDHNTNKGNTL